jgi:hypothetical protein
MTKTIKETIKGSKNPIQDIITKYSIDTNLWYVDSFKIKDGKWNTAGLKRKQDLKWTKETSKKGITTQIMEGSSKRYPEFILAENKTYSIEITFKRIPIEEDILDSFKSLIKGMPKFEIVSKINRKTTHNGIAAEMSTFDAHLGKLAWEKETGYRNFDLDIAVKDYIYTNDKNLDLIAPNKPEIIYYIIGQDMYHMDNMEGKTTRGEHTLDVDGRITKVHEKAFVITRDNIYKCRKIAPVEVIWIPGNHDYLASYMLCFALKEHFKDVKGITVDIGHNPRKARLWGTLLVGWTHRIVGKPTVWGNELAQQFPELWGKSKFREWHCGDQHKKLDTKINPVSTMGGVNIRQLTALSPVDRWHTDNVFTDAVPGGEAFLWSKEEGIFANFITWTGQYEDHRNNLIK